MNHWDRFVTAAKLKRVDRTPVAFFGTARFFAFMYGVPLIDFYRDPNIMIAAEKKVFERFPDITFLPGFWPDYSMGFFTAFGMKIKWPYNETSYVRDNRYQLPGAIESLEVPETETDGMWPWYLRNLKDLAKLKEDYPDRLKCLWSMGPGEVAGYLYGLTPLMELFAFDPKSLVHLLEIATNSIIRWLEAQYEILPDAEAILIADDITGFISEEMYRKFLMPYHIQIREHFKDLIIVFHNDMGSRHLFDAIAEVGFNVFQIGHTTSLSEAIKKIGHRICIMGNINTTDILVNGTIEDTKKAAQLCLKQANGSPGFILSSGGGLNPGIGAEKIDAINQVVLKLF